MEDISTLIWIGIGIFWFLTRLIRSGAKKVAGTQKKSSRQVVSRPTAPLADDPRTRIESSSSPSLRGGKGPPPIVPR